MLLYSTKLDQLYRFIAGKIILSRNLCGFIKGIHKFGLILSHHRRRKIFVWFFYRFIGDKNFGLQNCIALCNFFSKIVYLYSFKRYIFEYCCPPLAGADKAWKTNLVPKMKRTKKLLIITTAYCSNVSHQWYEHFYRLLYSSPRHRERWKERKETFN